MFIEHQLNLLVSSDENSGAVNKSNDGGSFQVNLSPAIEVPQDAVNVTVEVNSATVWFSSPNIVTGVNDKLYVDAPDTLDVLTSYIITIPQGLYDLAGLSEAIQRELSNAGAKTDTSVINLSADESTQKVEIYFNYTNVSIDFSPADTFRTLLGFNAAVYGPYDPIQSILADNVANMNILDYYLIKSDIVTQGIRINNSYSGVLTRVLIDVSPNRQIAYEPFRPALISANELAGSKRSTLRFTLTDQQGNQINTNSENWSAQIVIKWQMAYVVK